MIDGITFGDDPTFPWYAKFALIAFVTFILSVSSCTVLTSLDDAEEARAETEAHKAESAASEVRYAAEAATEKERLATLERLVADHGYGPVAARCAVEGWSTSASRETCERANALHEAARR